MKECKEDWSSILKQSNLEQTYCMPDYIIEWIREERLYKAFIEELQKFDKVCLEEFYKKHRSEI